MHIAGFVGESKFEALLLEGLRAIGERVNEKDELGIFIYISALYAFVWLLKNKCFAKNRG